MADTARRQLLRRIGRLIRKEVSSILRDRRTVITLVMMPLLLYPLLSIVFVVLAGGLGSEETPDYRIALAPADEKTLAPPLLAGHKAREEESRSRGEAETKPAPKG